MFTDLLSVFATYCVAFGKGDSQHDDDAAPEIGAGVEIKPMSRLKCVLWLGVSLVGEVFMRSRWERGATGTEKAASVAKTAGAVSELVKNQ